MLHFLNRFYEKVNIEVWKILTDFVIENIKIWEKPKLFTWPKDYIIHIIIHFIPIN